MTRVAQAVYGLGGVVTRAHLLRFVTRTELGKAIAAEQVRSLGRGRYGLPGLDDDRAAALRLRGVLCLTSAALHHGWPVAFPPRRPQVLVPRNRSVSPDRRRGVDLRRWDAVSDGIATSPEQTVLDCATQLPFLEAVCVGDSAIRSGECSRETLLRAAEGSRRSGRSERVAVVEALDGRAANPFESATRVLAGSVSGLTLVPQLLLPGYGYPDLRDPARRMLVECDSFTHHSARMALLHDTERYNTAALLRHAVLRFAYEHPFYRPDYVVRTLTAWVQEDDQAAIAARRDTVHCPRHCKTG